MLGEQNFGAYGQNSQLSYQQQNQFQQQQQQENLQQVSKDSHARVKYLRKMYSLLFLQLLFAVYIVSTAISHKGFADWILDNSFFSFWVCLVVFIAVQIAFLFSRSTISKTPVNIVFYIIHTITFAFIFTYWELNRQNDNYLYYGLQFFTLVIFSLVIHVLFAKKEITFQSVSLYILGSVYFATLMFEIFVTISTLSLYIISIIAIVWGFFIVWDNESIVGAKSQWSREDCYSGAIGVYIQLIILFLRLVDLIKSFIVKSRS